jgi:YspA, cpYpsA-related SLOG family
MLAPTMKVLVCGGGSYGRVTATAVQKDYRAEIERASRERETLARVLDKLHASIGITHVVCGRDGGAERLVKQWAERLKLNLAAYSADWSKPGNVGAFERNKKMLDAESPELVVAFPGGEVTTDLVAKARERGIKVLKVDAQGKLHLEE